jgi:hypothetical protein
LSREPIGRPGCEGTAAEISPGFQDPLDLDENGRTRNTIRKHVETADIENGVEMVLGIGQRGRRSLPEALRCLDEAAADPKAFCR